MSRIQPSAGAAQTDQICGTPKPSVTGSSLSKYGPSWSWRLSMLHVSSVLKNVFSVFSVWHRLMALFDAYDDERVPRFQTYIHIFAYAFTCLWGVARAVLCFKYNGRLRKALGP